MKKWMLLIVALLAMWQGAAAQDYFKDTVWTKRTDQAQGFYKVKFSNTDSLIVGHGYEMDLFYDAKTGNEVKRIPGNNEVFFINNDRNFIRLNQERTKFEIFDMNTYQVIDSLENDGIKVNEYPIIHLSNDERYIVAPIQRGFRIWDITTKKILKTKIYPNEPNLVDAGVAQVQFSCDGSKLIGQFGKTLQDPKYPGDPDHYKSYDSFTVYDFNTLDSIDAYPNSRGFIISKTCKYIVYGTGDPTYGVEIYDFITKQLILKLPINGPSLTGIEFSPDDKYLVTSNGPGTDAMFIWSIEKRNKIHEYPGSSFRCINISNDGKYIVDGVGRWIELLYTRFNISSIKNDNINLSVIYPNPANGIATIEFYQPVSDVTTINLIDINGYISKLIVKKYLESGNQSIQFTTNDLLIGTYFIEIKNAHISLTLKLVVNR